MGMLRDICYRARMRGLEVAESDEGLTFYQNGRELLEIDRVGRHTLCQGGGEDWSWRRGVDLVKQIHIDVEKYVVAIFQDQKPEDPELAQAGWRVLDRARGAWVTAGREPQEGEEACQFITYHMGHNGATEDIVHHGNRYQEALADMVVRAGQVPPEALLPQRQSELLRRALTFAVNQDSSLLPAEAETLLGIRAGLEQTGDLGYAHFSDTRQGATIYDRVEAVGRWERDNGVRDAERATVFNDAYRCHVCKNGREDRMERRYREIMAGQAPEQQGPVPSMGQ